MAAADQLAQDRPADRTCAAENKDAQLHTSPLEIRIAYSLHSTPAIWRPSAAVDELETSSISAAGIHLQLVSNA
jgi:hypothetical protein